MEFMTVSGQNRKPINNKQTIRDIAAELSKANQSIVSVFTTMIDHDHLNLNDVRKAIGQLQMVERLAENQNR